MGLTFNSSQNYSNNALFPSNGNSINFAHPRQNVPKEKHKRSLKVPSKVISMQIVKELTRHNKILLQSLGYKLKK